MSLSKILEKFNNLLPDLYAWRKGKKLNDLSDFNFIYEYNFSEMNDPIIAVKQTFKGNMFLEKKSKNIARFSGAKTFQQVKELTENLYQNGEKVEFKFFKEKAFQIVEKYNEAWLEAERNVAISNIENAKIFLESKTSGGKYLQYVAIGDELTRDDHESLNGIVLPINDPFWDINTPPNGYNCRCSVVEISQFDDDFKISTSEEIGRKTKEINEFLKSNPEFARNPAKTDWIFKETGKGKHAYFSIPAEYKVSFEKNNFKLQ